MNALKKQRVKAVIKYTWPLYIFIPAIIAILLNLIFGIVHRIPTYKTLTIFVSGEVKDSDKLESDMLNQYADNELKIVSTISAKPSDNNYNTKLTITGYNSADILIIPTSKLETLIISAFGLDMSDDLISSYYQGYSIFEQEDAKYGVKIDKEKVKEYFTLPDEDCYMVLNGNSVNLGEYSISPVKEHNTALKVVKEWGM